MQPAKKFYHVKIFFLTAMLIIAAGAYANTFGQSKDSTAKANMIKTFINGINSNNPGVAQRSIYLAGYYGFPWAVDPLINLLNDSSKEPALRIWAAYSLMMSGYDKAIDAVKSESIFERDHVLQGMCRYIYSDYLMRKDEIFTMYK